MKGGGDWRVQSPFDSTRDSSHFQQRKSHGTLITSKVINIDLKDKRSSLLPSSTSLLELKHLAIKCVTFLEFSSDFTTWALTQHFCQVQIYRFKFTGSNLQVQIYRFKFTGSNLGKYPGFTWQSDFTGID